LTAGRQAIPTVNTINRHQNCIICWRISQFACTSCMSSSFTSHRQKFTRKSL